MSKHPIVEFSQQHNGKLLYAGPKAIALHEGFTSKTIIGTCVGHQQYGVDSRLLVIDSNAASEEVKARFATAQSLSGDYRIMSEYSGPYYRFVEVDGFLIPQELSPPQKPYPHTCKYCKLPARKIGRCMLCSNTKCKSNNSIRKIYPTKASIRERYLDGSGWIICPKCFNNQVVYLGRDGLNGCYRCSDGFCVHRWRLELRDGYKMNVDNRERYEWTQKEWRQINER